MTRSRNSKIKTPRPYISWSQYSIFTRNPELYKSIYIDGNEIERNNAMALGSHIAEEFAAEGTGKAYLEHFKLVIPQLSKKEYPIKTELKNIPLYGILDQFNPRTKEIRETKTGKHWSQSKANKHEQLDFYALLVYAKYRKIPKSIHLDWIKTYHDSDFKLQLSGAVKSFEVEKTLQDILRFYIKVQKVWYGIQELCKQEK